jgi:hypothetical protein
MLLATAAVLVALNAARATIPSKDADRAVTYLALRIFQRDADELLSRDQGVFLIDPSSALLSEFPSSGSEDGCGSLEVFEASMISRNSASTAIAGAIPTSTTWRLATPEELAMPLFRLDRDTIRTRLTLLRPAYDAAGENELVGMAFVDGSHISRANFHFARTSAGWSERCVDIEHWP